MQGEEKWMNEAVRREEERSHDGGMMGGEEGRGREGEKGNGDSGVQISPEQMKKNENKKHDADRDKDMFALVKQDWHIHTEQSYFSVVF